MNYDSYRVTPTQLDFIYNGDWVRVVDYYQLNSYSVLYPHNSKYYNLLHDIMLLLI